jgi:quinol monooxygenase YgiN
VVIAPANKNEIDSAEEIHSNVANMVNEVANNINGEYAPITLIVNVEIHSDRISEFLEAITIDAIGSRLEPGCLRFDVLRDQTDSNKFTFFEVYETPSAIDFHKGTSHFKAWSDFKATGGVKSQSVDKLNAINFTY